MALPRVLGMPLGLEGKIAVVTASSKGLGRASALELARAGAKVVISSRNEANLSSAAELIKKEVPDAQIHQFIGDVADPKFAEQLVASTRNKFGEIDVLVCNAGGPRIGSFFEVKLDDWDAAYQLTLMSVVRLCYAVTPSMKERRTGSIIGIQSSSIKQPVPNIVLSNAFRLATQGLFKSLANELGPFGIRVNTINPSLTLTERVEPIFNDIAKKTGQTREQIIEARSKDFPIRRLGTAEEFGRVTAWLASPVASFITGHALMFDGGSIQSSL